MNKMKNMFWRHSFCYKLIKDVCIEYVSTFVGDAFVFSFAFKIVQVCFPLPLCLFLYICTCFVFWIMISLVFREKWFVKTWKRVAKRKSRIAIRNPGAFVTSKIFKAPSYEPGFCNLFTISLYIHKLSLPGLFVFLANRANGIWIKFLICSPKYIIYGTYFARCILRARTAFFRSVFFFLFRNRLAFPKNDCRK